MSSVEVLMHPGHPEVEQVESEQLDPEDVSPPGFFCSEAAKR